MLRGDPHSPLPADEVQYDIESEVPSTPRKRIVSWAGRRGTSPSSPGGDDSGSPERTPGPGEGSPVTMATQGEECEDPDETSCEMASVLAEAEERSCRRAAAIRGVLEQLRGDCADNKKEAEENEDESLPQPRVHPLPIPVPLPFSGGLSRERAPGTIANGTLQSNITFAHRSYPSPVTVSPLEERRLLKHCGTLEERLEQHQSVLDRTMGSLETEQHAAQEAHESLLRVEAEVAYTEGTAARKEAELRSEMMNMRAEYQRDRERLRNEGRRLQTSVKEIQARMKSEVQARTEAVEQVDSLKENLSAVRTDLQRRSREGQEARSAFAGLEKRLEQQTDLFKWITTRCNEITGEDVHEMSHKEVLGGDPGSDSLKRILARTFTLLERRANNDSDNDKENIGKGNPTRAVAQPRSKKVSEVTQRLAVVQQELLSTEVEHEEMISRQRSVQTRLSEAEEELQAVNSRLATNPAMRTEQRSRLRAAEDGQKRLQKQLTQAEEERQWQYTRHEEEHERSRSRLSSLQRAKEAAERYIAAEEDAWINAQREERALQSEYARMRSEINDAEANAREACSDAVEARAAAQLAAINNRRLEADLEELERQRLAPGQRAGRAHDCVGMPAPQMQLESQIVERLRMEISTFREEASRAHLELENELDLNRQKKIIEENKAVEWYHAAEKTQKDCELLRQALEEQAEASQNVQRQFQAEMEQQQAQQSRIDDAKRVMVNSAMEEQEQRLRGEIGYVEAAARTSYEEAVRQLQQWADEYQEQVLQLDYANNSIAMLQQREASLQAELQQQQFQDLSQQEQQICDFGRAELMAMTQEQEARLQEAAHSQTKHAIAESVASAEKRYSEELAHLRGCHAAAIAAVHGEYAGEIEAFRRLELTSRNELTHARLACEASEADIEENSRLEIEKAHAAQRALKDERRSLSKKIRDDLREQMLSELWVESCTKVRQEIIEDVRGNPCSQLRKELSRDLRHELADQVRAELRSELHSEIMSSNSSGTENVSPASTVRRRRRQRAQSATVCSTSASGSIGVGASPSSIGACSPGKSSPEYASSMILFQGSSSPSRWPENGELTSRDLGTSGAFATDFEPQCSLTFEKPAFLNRPNGVVSAPTSRQSSGPAIDGIQPVPPTGVFRQRTAPPTNFNRNLDGMFPMFPTEPCVVPEVISYTSLPPPPTQSNEYGLTSDRGAFRSVSLPQPPKADTPFEDQASAVLALVSRSRAPFRAQGFPLQGKEPEQSFGFLPPQPRSL